MSPATYTPFPGVSSQDVDANEWWLRREISLIQNLLKGAGRDEQGRHRRHARLQALGSAAFRDALKEGVERGAFRKTGQNRYAPAAG
jgi:hypothetical protein